MRIVADENVDMPVFEFLKKAGFNIEHISHLSRGSSDVDVLTIAHARKAILLTVDKDFGELAFRSKRPSFGIVLYRLSGLKNIEKAVIIQKVFAKLGKDLQSNFTVISEKQIRIRKLIF